MQYEEYKEIRKKLGRAYLSLEGYQQIVEPAYMALTNTDKDEFCALSDGVIADIATLAEMERKAWRRVEQESQDVAALIDKIGEKDEDAKKLAEQVKSLEAECFEAVAETGAAHAALDALLGTLPPAAVRKFIVAATRRNPAAFAAAVKQA
jgi:septal ring factor EnvC (AmiA/AmiB activator)